MHSNNELLQCQRILIRRISRIDVRPDLGLEWETDLLRGHTSRDQLVHSPLGTEMPRVTISELLRTAKAVRRPYRNAPLAVSHNERCPAFRAP